MRMRARAAERREARRRRRIRRVKYVAVGLVAAVFGLVGAATTGSMNLRSAFERMLNDRGPIEEAVVRQPIVIDWPPLPGPPDALKAPALGALPAPSDWNAVEASTSDAAEGAPPPPADTAAPRVASPVGDQAGADTATVAPRGETPDDVAYREPPVNRPAQSGQGGARGVARQPQAPPVAASDRTAVTPLTNRSTASTLGSSRVSVPVESVDRGTPAPPPVPAATRAAPARPPAAVELAPALANPPAPVTLASRSPDESSSPAPAPARRSPDEPRSTAAPASVQGPDQRASIRAVLDRYRFAYQRLDANAARAVWPGVDAGALSRAFSALSSQAISFESCSIDVSGESADATCRGESRVIPKIGGGSETARRTWNFKLRQAGRGWLIERASVK